MFTRNKLQVLVFVELFMWDKSSARYHRVRNQHTCAPQKFSLGIESLILKNHLGEVWIGRSSDFIVPLLPYSSGPLCEVASSSIKRIRGCTEINTPCHGIFSTVRLLGIKLQPFPDCIRDGVRPKSPWTPHDDRSESRVRRVWLAGCRNLDQGCQVRGWNVGGPGYNARPTL